MAKNVFTGFKPIGYSADGSAITIVFRSASGMEKTITMPSAMFEALVSQGTHIINTVRGLQSGEAALGQDQQITLAAHRVNVGYRNGNPDTLLQVNLPPPDVTSYAFVLGPEAAKELHSSIGRRLDDLPELHKTPSPEKRN